MSVLVQSSLSVSVSVRDCDWESLNDDVMVSVSDLMAAVRGGDREGGGYGDCLSGSRSAVLLREMIGCFRCWFF